VKRLAWLSVMAACFVGCQQKSAESSRVRVAAGDALASIGPEAEAAVPALVDQLNHPDARVRVAAMRAFAAIGPASVPALIGAFERPEPVVGVRAGISIRDIGQVMTKWKYSESPLIDGGKLYLRHNDLLLCYDLRASG